jgi:iron complex outermembrane receptor protein
MSKQFMALLCAGASLAATAPSVARAQVASPQTSDVPRAENAMAEVVVTARRVEERLQDVPISMTVFNQAQLDNRNIVNAQDLATFTPSLSTNNRYGAESSSFSIRGFVQEQNTAPSVAVYFADVVAPRVQGATTAGNGAGVGALFDLQNVQVLKGPQGTLFGRNTTGGAVLLVPQKPSRDYGGYVEASLGNYGMHRLQGVINLPISDTLRLRLGVDHMDRKGYLHNISGIGPKDFNDVNYTAGRASLVWDVTPDIENYTIASYSVSDTNGALPKIVNQDNIARDPFPGLRAAQIAATAGHYYDVENGLPEAHQLITQWQIINNTTWTANDNLTIKNIVSISHFFQKQNENIYGDNPYINGTSPPFFPINLVTVPGSHNAAEQTFTEEFRGQFRSNNDVLTGQAGIYFEKSKPLGGFQSTYTANNLACFDIAAFQCQNVSGFTPPRPITGFIQNSRSKYNFQDIGLYTQATFKLTKTLSLTGGIRYTSDKIDGTGQVLKIFFPTPNTPSYACSQPVGVVTGGTSAEILANPTLCNMYRSEKSHKPTWLIGLDWKPSEDLLLYAKYARGYRAGGVNVSSFGLETWKPESLDTYEVGFKSGFRGTISGTFNFAAFYNDFKNQQIATNTVSCGNVAAIPNYTLIFPACAGVPASAFPSPAQGISNTGASTIKGVEVESALSWGNFNLSGAYSYLDATLNEIGSPGAPAFGFATYTINAVVGGQLSYTPRNKYTVTATYNLPLDASVGDVSVGATFAHQDAMNGNTSSLTLFRLPAENTLNFNANWNGVAGKPIDLAFFMTNVTGDKNYNYAVGASFGWDAVGIMEPRMYGVRLRYRFG